jgi:hypothetical protein
MLRDVVVCSRSDSQHCKIVRVIIITIYLITTIRMSNCTNFIMNFVRLTYFSPIGNFIKDAYGLPS